jgi:hypothetical protein
VAARRPMMPRMMVPTRCCVMPMPRHVVRMADERPARTVPKHLPVTQPAAPPLGLARRTRGVVTDVPRAAMCLVRMAMSISNSTTADVDPAVRRSHARHRRKRRWWLGSGLRVRRRSRWNLGRGLLRRRERLVRRGLLRGQRRCENPECQSSANERGTMHDRLPTVPGQDNRGRTFKHRAGVEFSGAEARPVSRSTT